MKYVEFYSSWFYFSFKAQYRGLRDQTSQELKVNYYYRVDKNENVGNE